MIPVMMLAGGKGKRLKEVWSKHPKCLAPINGYPFLEYLLDNFVGFHRILSIGKDGNEIIYYIKALNYYNVDIVKDFNLIGTYSAVKETSKSINCDFILCNADSIFDINYNDFYERHLDSKKPISVALKRVNNDVGNFMQEDSNDLWTTYRKEGESYLNTGVYCINKKVFDVEFEDESGSFEKVLKHFDLNVEIHDEFFTDIGTPETYRAANYFFKNKRGEKYW